MKMILPKSIFRYIVLGVYILSISMILFRDIAFSIILSVGIPLSLYWYLAEVNLIWKSVNAFKAMRNIPLNEMNAEEILTIMKRLTDEIKNKRKKNGKEDQYDMDNGGMYS